MTPERSMNGRSNDQDSSSLAPSDRNGLAQAFSRKEQQPGWPVRLQFKPEKINTPALLNREQSARRICATGRRDLVEIRPDDGGWPRRVFGIGDSELPDDASYHAPK